MNDNLSKLLNNLEPIIDEKCLGIKKKRKEKKQDIKMVIICLCFAIIPSILLLFNISILYFIAGIILILSLKLFLKLPDILKRSLEVKCYE